MVGAKERYKLYIKSAVGAVIFCIILILFQNILSGEKGRIRNFIMEGRRAVESKNIFACVNMVSDDYHDKYGNDRSSLIYAAKEFFAYYEKTWVNIERKEIKIDGSKKQANVELVVLAIAQSKGKSREKFFEGEKGRFRVNLVKEKNKWRLLEIEFLEPVTLMGQRLG